MLANACRPAGTGIPLSTQALRLGYESVSGITETVLSPSVT